MNMIEKVARAIEIAGQHRPYGLYDYSSYKGTSAPHVVKDERTGERLFVSNDKEKAYEYWRKITQGYVAKAAIAAMREPTLPMVESVGSSWGSALHHDYMKMIDAALKEE